MLAIGEFSRLTHLSVKTLRRYHEAGLLVPDAVDQTTGYRFYDGHQIPTAQVIHRLRELDVPLADVRRIIESADPDRRAALALSVELRAVPEVTVAAIEDDIDSDSMATWYVGAMAELNAAIDARSGPPGGVYDNALFEKGRGHVLLHVPAADPPRRGRVRPATLPAVELAVATHVGPHDDADISYGELGSWVVANALAVAGPVRETYLVGPSDDPDPSAWRTEIGWPIFRMS